MGWARNDLEKAEVFANHLETIFRPFPRQTANENTDTHARIDSVDIEPVKRHELKEEVKSLKTRKAPGYDLITNEILQELPNMAVKKLLQLVNAAIRLRYVPMQWKVAEVIMIQKTGKVPTDKNSYRPISLLPVIAKLFEKLLLKRLKPLLEDRNLIPNHQFGFRNKHSTLDQVNRITETIENTLERGEVCSGIFLDVSQAFDKVWHKGLIYKLEKNLPKEFCQILRSYLSDRLFRVKQGNEYSQIREICAGVPQGSVLGPVLYLLYTNDIPQHSDTSIHTFADDTAVIAVGETVMEATTKLQEATDRVSSWTKKWRIQLNETKSTHINFTNKKMNGIPVVMNSNIIPYRQEVKYLGMTLDAKLTWKAHIKRKREELSLKWRKMLWLFKSKLSTYNKLLLYRQILKPVWTYGAQLWGCAKKTNINKIQTFQNKVLRTIVNAPWYVKNETIHKDLKVNTVKEEIKAIAARHERRLHTHANPTVANLIESRNAVRRLRRTKTLDLVQ